MRRRLGVSLLAATALAVPAVLPAGAASTQLPTAGCFSVVDEVGDVSDPDLDLLGAAFRTTAAGVQVYVRVSSLATSPQIGAGHRFAVAFTLRDHRFQAAGSAFSLGQGGLRDALAPVGGATTQLSVDGAFVASGLSVAFDLTRSFVVFDIPAQDLARYGGGALNGVLSGIDITSAREAYVTSVVADSTTPAGQRPSAAYALGDNRCFGPAPASLELLSGTVAQYGDRLPVTARLRDAAGRPLSSRAVSVSLAGAGVTATTGSDGVLRTTLDPRVIAGSYALVLSWSGDSAAGSTSLSRAVTVVPESTLLSLRSQRSNGDNYVLASLKDDDGQPVVGANIAFRWGGSTSTLRTSSRGVVELHGLAKGDKVTASFAGVSGQYTASSASVTVDGNNGRDDRD